MKYEDAAILEQGSETGGSTIFDDVFRTIAQKIPYLLIPLINEVFGYTLTSRSLSS